MQISLILMREIVQLFIILLMGYIIVRAKLLRPEDSRSLSVVMVYLLTPCVIINAFQVEYTPQVMAGLIFSFAISIAAHILFLLLTRLLAGPLHLDVIERTAVIYTNAGILVIPLVNALLGPEYVIYSCAFIVVQQVLIWTHCRSLLCGTRGMEWRKLFLNVNIIAIVAGCALFLLRVPLPALINDTLGTLGDMFGPLGMLLAGMVIADTPLRRLFTTPRNYLPVLLRLLAFPLVTVLLLRAAGAAGWIADGKNILMIVYLACITPACATVTSLAQLYDRNAAYSSALYVLTTLLSIVTMPVMIGVYDALI
ncbi:AEC family transporter [Agathobaculum sp. NSJ-28]|uniref:AEC family transporter n=2 Tax=Agathobaculum TaxID=2048137 RepID=A0A923LVI1_9FIRM|nr:MULTISPECIES: AEC family transporter [Butyricicoccaceae]MBC5725072.1 AEC family transporter [Agathobaculum faecis]MCU6789725.1 AEC family transporter [Agathobaculum ammoniilyticum]WOC74549.1 AEC family transporter [Intestinibacillus sp. NTUH-41-i26]SCJ34763.1 auxin efflux carrier [uncultured Butyricicoccus sp.]